MTAVRSVWIACDFCDRQCPDALFVDTAKRARWIASREGWRYGAGKDICPECWERGER